VAPANEPDAVFLAAGRVGGIYANSTFIADNLAIAKNVIEGPFAAGVKKLLFLGSSCIYPKMKPMAEDMLLTGPLEPTNQWYAIAKIAGIKLCEAFRQHGADFISVMPTNLYGPGDNYHPNNSHVPAALIPRFHEAKMHGEPQVPVWKTGAPLREFLAADDLADACIFVMKHYSQAEFLNVGTGEEISIGDFARLIAEIVGYRGVYRIRHHPSGRHAAQAARRVATSRARLACQYTPASRAGLSRRRFSLRRRPPGRVTGPDGKQPRARLRFLSGLRRTSALTVRGTTSVQTPLSRAGRAQ
jgi:nucleoside-diphosphate-sugar epimerase